MRGMSIYGWLTWVFESSSTFERRLVCCTIWALWLDYNKNTHEGKEQSGAEVTNFITQYLQEIDKVEEKQTAHKGYEEKWVPPMDSMVKVNFDAAVNTQLHRSTSGLIARNFRGEVLASVSRLHDAVESPFAAEALACWDALSIGIECGWPSVIVEGDSRSVINKCKSLSQEKSNLGVYIRNIHKEIQGFLSIDF